ncbi:hypothetical protein DFS33DRAFT_348019 [Desarmillaria ectypa]|nr:hypothetical protein DFS33DRAFT_348019 [Desarmillaria ectypa]
MMSWRSESKFITGSFSSVAVFTFVGPVSFFFLPLSQKPSPHTGGQNGLPLTLGEACQLTMIAASALLGVPLLPADATDSERSNQYDAYMRTMVATAQKTLAVFF